jgi:hypothetical protein
MGRQVVLVVAGLLTSGLSGCASARYVQQGADGGVVAVQNGSNDWPSYNLNKAFKLIEQHVGPEYEIVWQGEQVVGQATTNNQNVQREVGTNSEIPFLPAEKTIVTNSTTSRDVTEWRIHYRKRLPGPPAPSGVVQTGHTVPAGPVGSWAGGMPPPQDANPFGGRQ